MRETYDDERPRCTAKSDMARAGPVPELPEPALPSRSARLGLHAPLPDGCRREAQTISHCRGWRLERSVRDLSRVQDERDESRRGGDRRRYLARGVGSLDQRGVVCPSEL